MGVGRAREGKDYRQSANRSCHQWIEAWRMEKQSDVRDRMGDDVGKQWMGEMECESNQRIRWESQQ